MTNDLLYQLALTKVPTIGCVHAKILSQQYGTAESIFKAKLHQLEELEGIGRVRAKSIKNFTDFPAAEAEIKFIEKYKITPLFLTDKNYPQRLLNCYDSPTLLYYKGNADLNSSKIIAIVGTRNHTDYAKHVTDKFIKELAEGANGKEQNILVVSGMAYGVDAIAHKAALKNKMATVGVLAHGLDQIYPPQHSGLAKDMLKNDGGLLTEFRSKTKPDKHNFPTRNRIVAGMSDATIVIETGIKGGSMITAELANGYNRDVFALPGKVTDAKSAGCNYLIKTNKAMLLTDAQELIEVMGWEEKLQKTNNKFQKELFIELSKDEKIVVNILKEKETVSIDEINLKSGLSSSAVAVAILNMELQGVVLSLPGKLYKLN
ncbi:MAG TPA: DNA-processing protein DprA [Chitinophagaceae bacterium]|nr:DNA-processing protein DprA [Chitinophagaceae bacterium]